MRQRKPSDSPSDYPRDVYRRRLHLPTRIVRQRERVIGCALVQPDDEYRDCYGNQMPNEDIAIEGRW